MVEEMVRPFFANFFLNNKLLAALLASVTLVDAERVALVLVLKASGKKVSVVS